MKTERERSKMEMKDLQQQLSDMHDELDQAKKAEVINTEKDILLKVSETRCRRYTSRINSSCKSSFTGPELVILCYDECLSGYGAAACGISGGVAGERGAGGGPAPPGTGAQCPEGGAQRRGGDP